MLGWDVVLVLEKMGVRTGPQGRFERVAGIEQVQVPARNFQSYSDLQTLFARLISPNHFDKP